MISQLFTGVAGIFKGFFSRSFWLAAFTPCMMVLVLNLFLGWIAFPQQVPLDVWVSHGVKDDLIVLPIGIAVVVILAYAIGPLASVGRSILDGSLLPTWLYKRLRDGRLAQAYVAKQKVADADDLQDAFQDFLGDGLEAVRAARKAGIAAAASGDATQLRDALTMTSALSTKIAQGKLPTTQDVSKALSELTTAFRENAADVLPTAPADSQARRLDTVFGDFTVALQRAASELALQSELLESRYGSLATDPTPRATRMGDVRASAERYSEERYGVRFSFIWPRLMLLRAAAEHDPVADAQAQLDFSVNSFFLTGVTVAIWLPVFAVTARTPWTFLILAGAGPAVCALLYEVAVVTQATLGEMIKGVIDKQRLDVLALLNQTRPATLDAELAAWKRLRLADEGAYAEGMVYRFAP